MSSDDDIGPSQGKHKASDYDERTTKKRRVSSRQVIQPEPTNQESVKTIAEELEDLQKISKDVLDAVRKPSKNLEKFTTLIEKAKQRQFKLAFCGAQGAGKTALILRLLGVLEWDEFKIAEGQKVPLASRSVIKSVTNLVTEIKRGSPRLIFRLREQPSSGLTPDQWHEVNKLADEDLLLLDSDAENDAYIFDACIFDTINDIGDVIRTKTGLASITDQDVLKFVDRLVLDYPSCPENFVLVDLPGFGPQQPPAVRLVLEQEADAVFLCHDRGFDKDALKNAINEGLFVGAESHKPVLISTCRAEDEIGSLAEKEKKLSDSAEQAFDEFWLDDVESKVRDLSYIEQRSLREHMKTNTLYFLRPDHLRPDRLPDFLEKIKSKILKNDIINIKIAISAQVFICRRGGWKNKNFKKRLTTMFLKVTPALEESWNHIVTIKRGDIDGYIKRRLSSCNLLDINLVENPEFLKCLRNACFHTLDRMFQIGSRQLISLLTKAVIDCYTKQSEEGKNWSITKKRLQEMFRTVTESMNNVAESDDEANGEALDSGDYSDDQQHYREIVDSQLQKNWNEKKQVIYQECHKTKYEESLLPHIQQLIQSTPGHFEDGELEDEEDEDEDDDVRQKRKSLAEQVTSYVAKTLVDNISELLFERFKESIEDLRKHLLDLEEAKFDAETVSDEKLATWRAHLKKDESKTQGAKFKPKSQMRTIENAYRKHLSFSGAVESMKRYRKPPVVPNNREPANVFAQDVCETDNQETQFPFVQVIVHRASGKAEFCENKRAASLLKDYSQVLLQADQSEKQPFLYPVFILSWVASESDLKHNSKYPIVNLHLTLLLEANLQSRGITFVVVEAKQAQLYRDYLVEKNALNIVLFIMPPLTKDGEWPHEANFTLEVVRRFAILKQLPAYWRFHQELSRATEILPGIISSVPCSLPRLMWWSQEPLLQMEGDLFKKMCTLFENLDQNDKKDTEAALDSALLKQKDRRHVIMKAILLVSQNVASPLSIIEMNHLAQVLHSLEETYPICATIAKGLDEIIAESYLLSQITFTWDAYQLKGFLSTVDDDGLTLITKGYSFMTLCNTFALRDVSFTDNDSPRNVLSLEPKVLKCQTTLGMNKHVGLVETKYTTKCYKRGRYTAQVKLFGCHSHTPFTLLQKINLNPAKYTKQHSVIFVFGPSQDGTQLEKKKQLTNTMNCTSTKTNLSVNVFDYPGFDEPDEAFTSKKKNEKVKVDRDILKLIKKEKSFVLIIRKTDDKLELFHHTDGSVDYLNARIRELQASEQDDKMDED